MRNATATIYAEHHFTDLHIAEDAIDLHVNRGEFVAVKKKAGVNARGANIFVVVYTHTRPDESDRFWKVGTETDDGFIEERPEFACYDAAAKYAEHRAAVVATLLS